MKTLVCKAHRAFTPTSYTRGLLEMTYKPNSQMMDVLMPLCREASTTPQRLIEFLILQTASMEDSTRATLFRELSQ